MKVRHYILVITLAATLIISGLTPASAAKSLRDKLGLPVPTGAILVNETDLSPGSLLKSVEDEYASKLGVSDLRRLIMVTYSVDASIDIPELFDSYEAKLLKDGWKSRMKSVNKGGSTIALSSEKDGLIILQSDPVLRKNSRQFTITWLLCDVGLDSLRNSGADVPKIEVDDPSFGSTNNSAAPRIPSGQPLSIPPARWMKLETTNSDINARLRSGNTLEVHLKSSADDVGKLIRAADGIILTLFPKLQVSEIILPGTIPITVETTGGSLKLASDFSSFERPASLRVVSTGAPVSLEDFPLVSETHIIKVVGGKVEVSTSRVEGGVLNIDCTGGDVVLGLPKNASATLNIEAPSGKIKNYTGVQPVSESGNKMRLKLGDGKAQISVKAVNGTVHIEFLG